jgi:hypothetical protein
MLLIIVLEVPYQMRFLCYPSYEYYRYQVLNEYVNNVCECMYYLIVETFY